MMIGMDNLVALLLLIVGAFLSIEASPLYTGDKRNFNREFMHFGKRSPANYYDLDAANDQLGGADLVVLGGEKRAAEPFSRQFLNFGKKRAVYEEPFAREFLNFGR